MQLSLSSPKDVPQDAYPFFPPFVPSLCDFYVRSEFFLRSPVKQVAAALATYFWHRLRLKLLLESRLRLWTGKSRRSLLGGGEKTANSENSCQTRKNVAKVNFRFIFIEIVFLQCCCSSPKQKKKGIWPKKIDLHRRDCVTNQDEFNFFQCISPALWRHFLWRPVDWLTPIWMASFCQAARSFYITNEQKIGSGSPCESQGVIQILNT